MINIIQIPGSISYSRYVSKMKHNWKSSNKTSFYDINNMKISLRFSATAMKKISEIDTNNNKVNINFIKENDNWIIDLHRNKTGKICRLSLYSHKTSRSRIQIGINSVVPEEIKQYFTNLLAEKGKSAGATLSVLVRFTLSEWLDADIKPWDFIDGQDIRARSLMQQALSQNFRVFYIPKGRFYDLQLIGKNKVFSIAIFTHNTENKSRAKYKRVNKLLTDVAKMLPVLYNDKTLTPVVVSQPIIGAWSVSTDNYLEFYKNIYRFNYIFTDFKEGWEHEVCDQLLKIDG